MVAEENKISNCWYCQNHGMARAKGKHTESRREFQTKVTAAGFYHGILQVTHLK